MPDALLYAGIGGVMWGFSPFGKRYGVATATPENRATLSAVTYLTYALGTFMFPAGDFLVTPSTSRERTFTDPDWRKRLPAIVACGFASGCGGLCATYALALAGRNASCLISMVTNGIYSVVAALLIMEVFSEEPSALQWISAVLIFIGVLMMEAGVDRGVEKKEDSHLMEGSGTTEEAPESAQWYGAVQQWCARASHAWTENTAFATHLLSVFYSVLAGILWAFGPLGKRYGAGGAEEGMRAARSACTFFVYNLATFLPVLCLVAFTALTGKLSAPVERSWLWRAPVVLLCGIIGGLGGVLATYAFALAGENESSLLSMVENGLYTAAGALLIGLTYQERLTNYQLGAAVLMILAVVCAYAA
mmetsp:Transcript_593/g.1445  ORF Transcript_593/g.1445 Transcript_593/m.1445 type:complete len:363 (-) Transcript_593:47-1135(-)|eukprot:CAMPEP_0195066504 /NCGR_PEP_ID=MMETSP0448-20130528/11838_1 /TAXON_ID=66468 /ORGANISM="Heterocapsa triquestra, Strain CCMP 448" /LENGTH=362 /DNA_ID=CAMNT_0040097769 /DNA_START=81 /DNA_END=1169 /DNA_ORIENTATION=-